MDSSNEIGRLLVTRRPKPDESFMGYVLRLTALNRYITPSWILRMAINRYAENRVEYAFYDNLNLSRLVQLTGINKGELSSLLYQTATPLRKKFGEYLVFGSPVTRYVIRPFQSKICPACLRESEYIRKIWDLAPVTACPIHRCLLLDTCPNCMKRISWIRSSISHCRCKFDWREQTFLKVQRSELEVTIQIHRLCNLNGGASTNVNGSEKMNPLYDLELKHFLSALFFVGSQYSEGIDTEGKHMLPLRKNAEIHALLNKAFLTFNDWPNNFYSFLDWRRTQTSSTRFMSGVNKEFKEYKHTLYGQLSCDSFDFLRSAFEEYLTTRWDGGYTTRMTRISIDARLNNKYTSHTEARKLLKTVQINELISAGRLKAIVKQQGKTKLVLIERASIIKLKNEFEQAVGIDKVSQLLTLKDVRIKELIKAGLLNPLRGPSVSGRTRWKFSLTEINKLLEDFCEKSKPYRELSGQIFLSFRAVLKKLDRFNVRLSTLIKAVLDGEVRPYVINDQLELSKFLFVGKDISKFVVKKLLPDGEDAYPVQEIMKLLGVSMETAYFLIKKEIIPSKPESSSLSCGLFVTKQDLDYFNATYVLAAKIASSLNTSSTHLTQLLNAQGVMPISGRKIDGGIVNVFKKSDLDKIDLPALISKAKIESRLLKGSPKFLDEVQVASFFQTDVSTVRQMVERGVLNPHRNIDRKANGMYYFSHYIVKKIKRHWLDYTSLILLSVAAKLLKLSSDNFSKKYVRTGRLKVVKREGKRGQQRYFLWEDVKELIEIDKQSLIAPEAAIILVLRQSGFGG